MKIDKIPQALMIALLEGKAVELVGWYGIGKSSLVRQLAELLVSMPFTVTNKRGQVIRHKAGEPVGLVECLIPTYMVEDVRGFPLPDYERGEMYYSVPPFFPSSRKFPNGIPKIGIIFLDEYRLGPDEVVKASTQLLLEGRIGDHDLAEYGHWVVFAASNREEDRVGIGKEAPIITQRKMVINMEPDHATSLSWLEKNEERLGVPPVFRLFMQDNPNEVLSMKTPDTGAPFCTPRTLVEAGQLMRRYMEMTHFKGKNAYDIPMDGFAMEIMASKIGDGTAGQLQAYAGLVGQVPKYEDIIRAPKTCTLPEFERLDANFVVITVIEAQIGNYSKDENGELDAELLDKEVDSVVTYLMRLPAEFQVTGLRRTLNKRPEVYGHPKVRQIARENPSVLKAISGA